MKTMEKLVKRFNRLNPNYYAELDWTSSYEGWYTVLVADMYYGDPARYHFRTCNEFREWMDGVVLE